MADRASLESWLPTVDVFRSLDLRQDLDGGPMPGAASWMRALRPVLHVPLASAYVRII